MLATNSLYFLSFKLPKYLKSSDIIEKIFFLEIDSTKDDDRFVPKEISGGVVDGYYVFYTNSKELTYNNETNALEVSVVKKNTVVPFSIDIEHEILDVWSNKSNVNRLVTQLGIRLEHNVQIEPININLKKIVGKLDGKVRVGKIRIGNYQIEQDIVATCIFDLSNHNKPIDIVKKYSNDLLQVALTVSNTRGELLSLMIYQSGSVVIYKNKDEISQDTFDIVREICIR